MIGCLAMHGDGWFEVVADVVDYVNDGDLELYPVG